MIKEFRVQYKDLVKFNQVIDEKRSSITADIESEMRDQISARDGSLTVRDGHSVNTKEGGAINNLLTPQPPYPMQM